jgi:hypothetical protein
MLANKALSGQKQPILPENGQNRLLLAIHAISERNATTLPN